MSGARWPSVQDYIDWAVGQGCTVEASAVACGEQRMIAVTIVAPSGARVIELVEELADPLMSTSIARLDRRLGLKSYRFE